MSETISDNKLPYSPIINNEPYKYTVNNTITTKAGTAVNLIFLVIIILFICILLHDINLKILNLYYNTKCYNNNLIIKLFSI